VENAVSRWASCPSDDKRGCLCDRVDGPAVPLLHQISEYGIWKKSLDSGQESRLPIHVCWWSSWDVARDGIYFLNMDFSPSGRIEFFDFAHGQSTPIFALDKPFPCGIGLALSPDGKSVLFGQMELAESYIMVMKNFR
jgi:hypothetical protein